MYGKCLEGLYAFIYLKSHLDLSYTQYLTNIQCEIHGDVTFWWIVLICWLGRLHFLTQTQDTWKEFDKGSLSSSITREMQNEHESAKKNTRPSKMMFPICHLSF